MAGTSKAVRTWHKLQEIALFDLIIKSRPIDGSWDGKRADEIEVAWEPIVEQFNLEMPPLVENIKALLALRHNSEGVRLAFDEEACRTMWRTWVTKYKKYKVFGIGAGETGKVGGGMPGRDQAKTTDNITNVYFHLFSRFLVEFDSVARKASHALVDSLDMPGKPKAVQRSSPVIPKVSKLRRDGSGDDSDLPDPRPSKRAKKFTQHDMEAITNMVEKQMNAAYQQGKEYMAEYREISAQVRIAITEDGKRATLAEATKLASEERLERLRRVASLRSDFIREGYTIAAAQKAAIDMDNELQIALV